MSIALLPDLTLPVGIDGCALAQEERGIRYSTDHDSVLVSLRGESETVAPELRLLTPNAKAQVRPGGSFYQPIEAMSPVGGRNPRNGTRVCLNGPREGPYCTVRAIPMSLSIAASQSQFRNSAFVKYMQQRILGKSATDTSSEPVHLAPPVAG